MKTIDYISATPPADDSANASHKQANRASIDPALAEFIRQACQSAAADAANTAGKLASQMMTDALANVENRLAAIDAPAPKVVAIQLNDVMTKLPAPVSQQTAKILGRMVINAQLGLNTMLVGPTGCGKTVLCKMLAEILKVDFNHISWTEGMSETAALFARQFHDKTLEASFSKTYRNGGVFLNDELDKANPNAAGKLNMALANGHFYNEVLHENITRHPNFVAVAACNAPRGGDAIYTATNRLSADALNRFIQITVDYDPEYEKTVCPNRKLYNALISARAKLRQLKSDEIISTRTIESAYKQWAAGVDLADILASMTLGWPPETVESCHLDRLIDLSAKDEPKAVDYTPAAPEPGTDTFNDDAKSAQIRANEAKIAELKRKIAAQARS